MSEIRTTLGALLHAEPALTRLLDVRLPVKTAYHLGKLARLVSAETKQFEDQRNKWVIEFGEDRAPTAEEAARNGGQPVPEVKREHYGTFFARLNELAAVNVTIAWEPLPLAALGDVEVSGADLNALGPLLAE